MMSKDEAINELLETLKINLMLLQYEIKLWKSNTESLEFFRAANAIENTKKVINKVESNLRCMS